MIRFVRLLVGVATAVAVGVPLGAGTAHAAAGDMTCGGTLTTTYSPGVTLIPTEQTVTTNEIDAPCTSASNPDITSGHAGITINLVASCLDLVQPGSATKIFTWSTGQTSVFSSNRTISRVGGNTVITLTGTITQGLFAGDTAVEVLAGPTLDILKCLAPPGITSLFYAVTLTIN